MTFSRRLVRRVIARRCSAHAVMPRSLFGGLIRPKDSNELERNEGVRCGRRHSRCAWSAVDSPEPPPRSPACRASIGRSALSWSSRALRLGAASLTARIIPCIFSMCAPAISRCAPASPAISSTGLFASSTRARITPACMTGSPIPSCRVSSSANMCASASSRRWREGAMSSSKSSRPSPPPASRRATASPFASTGPRRCKPMSCYSPRLTGSHHRPRPAR